MRINIKIPSEYHAMYARTAGSIAQVIQDFNSEEPVDIFLIYDDNRVNACSIVNWLVFSIHQNKEFSLESELSTLNELTYYIDQIFKDYSNSV
jgi:phosphotransferase system HPr-like phosphotransfer protein